MLAGVGAMGGVACQGFLYSVYQTLLKWNIQNPPKPLLIDSFSNNPTFHKSIPIVLLLILNPSVLERCAKSLVTNVVVLSNEEVEPGFIKDLSSHGFWPASVLSAIIANVVPIGRQDIRMNVMSVGHLVYLVRMEVVVRMNVYWLTSLHQYSSKLLCSWSMKHVIQRLWRQDPTIHAVSMTRFAWVATHWGFKEWLVVGFFWHGCLRKIQGDRKFNIPRWHDRVALAIPKKEALAGAPRTEAERHNYNTIAYIGVIGVDGTVRELTSIDLIQFTWNDLAHWGWSGRFDCGRVLLD